MKLYDVVKKTEALNKLNEELGIPRKYEVEISTMTMNHRCKTARTTKSFIKGYFVDEVIEKIETEELTKCDYINEWKVDFEDRWQDIRVLVIEV